MGRPIFNCFWLLQFTLVLAAVCVHGNSAETPAPAHAATPAPHDAATVAAQHEAEHQAEMSAEKKQAWAMVAVLVMLFICAGIVYILIKRQWTFTPTSLAIVAFGALLGLIVRFSGFADNVVFFVPEALFLYLIPPIIFEAGYSVHKGHFFKAIGSIILFALVGTLVAFFVISIFLFFLGAIGWSTQLTIFDSMLFGALSCATDPVSTLAVMQTFSIDQTLYMLVFGESVINNAVAIVLFDVVTYFYEGTALTAESAFLILGQFLGVTLGSVLMGVAVSLAIAFILRIVPLHKQPALELTLIFIGAFIPYLMAEGAGLSGIMALLFGALMMGHYTYYSMSPVTQWASQIMFKFLAFVCETSIFGYLGISVVTFGNKFDVRLIVFAILFCLVGRAVSIIPLGWLLNIRARKKLPPKHLLVMWFAGLRGAIAFSLATKIHTENREVLVTTTLVLVIFTMIVFGGGMLPVLRAVGETQQAQATMTTAMGAMGKDSILTEPELNELRKKSRGKKGEDHRTAFERADDRFLKRIFRRVYSVPAMKSQIKELTQICVNWFAALKRDAARSLLDPEFDMEGGRAKKPQAVAADAEHTEGEVTHRGHGETRPLAAESAGGMRGGDDVDDGMGVGGGVAQPKRRKIIKRRRKVKPPAGDADLGDGGDIAMEGLGSTEREEELKPPPRLLPSRKAAGTSTGHVGFAVPELPATLGAAAPKPAPGASPFAPAPAPASGHAAVPELPATLGGTAPRPGTGSAPAPAPSPASASGGVPELPTQLGKKTSQGLTPAPR